MSDEPRELPPNEQEQPPYELDPRRGALVGCHVCLSTVAVVLFAFWALVGRRG